MTIDDILEAAEKAFPETMELSVTMEAKYLKMYEYVVARANLAPQLAAEVRRLREREKVLTEALGEMIEYAEEFADEYARKYQEYNMHTQEEHSKVIKSARIAFGAKEKE